MLVHAASSSRSPVALWPPAVIEAVAQGADVAPRLTITLPDGSQVVFGGRQVQRWGTIDESPSLLDGKLAAAEARVRVVDDEPRTVARLAHRWGARLRGCLAEIQLVSPAWPADQAPSWRRVVGGPLEQTSEQAWEIPLRPDDAVLRDGVFPRQRITRALWPGVKEPVASLPLPIIYGPWDSTGVGVQGLVPAYLVGDVQTLPVPYLVGLGRVHVRQVYVAGALRDASTYTVTMRRGATAVELGEDTEHTQELTATTTVTVDVDGYDDVGDWTGTLITNPVRQMRHLLDNFWWGDWRPGTAWLTGTAPIDERSWADVADRLERRGYRGAMWFVRERTRPQTILDAWCDGLGVVASWTDGGRIALALPDPTDQRVYLDSPHLLGSSRTDGLERAPASGDTLTRRVECQYGFNAATGGYAQALVVLDQRRSERSEISRQVQYLATEP